jgi:hypothetical protein
VGTPVLLWTGCLCGDRGQSIQSGQRSLLGVLTVDFKEGDVGNGYKKAFRDEIAMTAYDLYEKKGKRMAMIYKIGFRRKGKFTERGEYKFCLILSNYIKLRILNCWQHIAPMDLTAVWD